MNWINTKKKKYLFDRTFHDKHNTTSFYSYVFPDFPPTIHILFMSTLKRLCTMCSLWIFSLFYEKTFQMWTKNIAILSNHLLLFFPMLVSAYNHVPIEDTYRQKMKGLSISLLKCCITYATPMKNIVFCLLACVLIVPIGNVANYFSVRQRGCII